MVKKLEEAQAILATARQYRVKSGRDELKKSREFYKKAIEAFKNIRNKHPDAEPTNVLLAQAYFELGDTLYVLAVDSEEQESKKREAHKYYQKAKKFGHPEAEERLDAPQSSGEAAAEAWAFRPVFFTEKLPVENVMDATLADAKRQIRDTRQLAALLRQTQRKKCDLKFSPKQ
jgi:tetratricopeptide (TPR) repeat protein